LLRLLRKLLKADRRTLESETFRERIRGFLVVSEPGKQIAIRLGSNVCVLPKRSRRNGHFRGTIRIPVEDVPWLEDAGSLQGSWLRFDVVTREEDQRQFCGQAQLIGRHGISVISDIDDTIKHSEVDRRRALLTNTFLNEFRAVPGMSELYRSWAERGAAFHYVSSSPWQLYECLLQLCCDAGFPPGTFHLRSLQLRDPSVVRLFVARSRSKWQSIKGLLRAFPQRRFVLVGDSGEKDPELYGAIARRHPGQIAGICIRLLPHRPRDSARFQRAFRGVPAGVCRVFRDPAALTDLLSRTSYSVEREPGPP
jgi:hypothetical protein